MTISTDIQQNAVDFHGLNQLRQSALNSDNDDQTLQQVAAQFEALFTTMMLKSMRQASLAEGIFDSNHSKTYREMADQQLAMDLSKRGGLGLQDVIIRQLGGEVRSDIPEGGKTFGVDTIIVRQDLRRIVKELHENTDTIADQSIDSVESRQLNPLPQRFRSPEDFVEQLWPLAQKAADALGTTADVILSQAALETGWGRYVLKDGEGQSSFNLFNIKADSRWDGDFVAKNALEYRDGKPVAEQSRFRSYDDYQQSFDDYVSFLQSQPRYQEALRHVGRPETFVEKLHEAGYATDPQYANKIKRIMNSDTLAQNSHKYIQNLGY
ncbi:flagellar assembly peptidoglycan hydrolase FlgJ [Methylophaga pinxianii]|uniref:flagellar assembly peptidoglycan hydrolase FlgJ n=1 Tax=Methylophaga pinxianii TaxID=2881052 RepID=UPI001CF166BF|nr:flagellar assembly peptidoglycan hydrolase FlgJ [Methylophaga pinxianii]MCB2427787.1 flagellar assembly peptidoglycan hydrolase FlgJ [Methylophaga pinxianii]UPH45608.1 flagellar assembly peptidoglycan hydrolase FlgJ [Methylophaga pinxianii]